MADPVIIFRTQSDIEASIVRGLLDAHGIAAMPSSDLPHSVFPLSIDGLGEVRLTVRAEDADEARRVIADYREENERGRVVRLRDEFEDLQASIAYRFRDRGLLEHALTHRSRAHEDVTGGVADNESLEFLGDAVLGFAIADLLFRRFPQHDEGQKSKMKSALVSAPTLARLAERIDLGRHLLLGRGEEKTGGRRKLALLADVYEALIAAIYLDGGMEPAQVFIAREFADGIDDLSEPGAIGRDYKSALQELLQSRGDPLPDYRVTGETGPPHHRLFEVSVFVRGDVIATGVGRSKKEGEQEAARCALERMGGLNRSQ